MSLGLVGRKCGMTRIFTEAGVSVPVTVIEVQPNRVTQVKTAQTDGYAAVQVTTGARRLSRVNKPMAGHFAKAKVEAGRGVWEFTLPQQDNIALKPGDELGLDLFQVGQKVDVIGVSKGKGFAGAVKRHNFKTQDASHGNSLAHRALGSIGQCQTPGRVFKGKKMPGHMGAKRCTVQHQEIIRIDGDKGLMLVKGVVPGAPGGNVFILPSVKQGNVVSQGGE